MRQSEFDEFLPLFEEANQRYLRGDLVGALSLATEGQERFPDERAPLYYLRATLKARMDDPAGALELLTESLSQGYWYPDSRWASDAFNKLQTRPEFIRQRTLSNRREAEAQAGAKSQLTVLLPKALAAAKAAASAAASAAANAAPSSAETAAPPNVPAVTAVHAGAVTNTTAPTDAGASTGTTAPADTITNTAAPTDAGASTGTTSPASPATNTTAPAVTTPHAATAPASPVTNTTAPAVTTPHAATAPVNTVTNTTAPSANDKKWPLLMALHGSGYGTRHDSAYWQAVTSQDWLLGMPQSSQITGYESYAWSDYAASEIDLTSHYDVLRQQYPVDTSRVVIAGKSQGAETAIRLVLSGMIPACGFIAIVPNGPMMLRAAEWEPLVQNANRDLRGYVLIGGREAHFAASGRRLVEMLRTRGIVCALDYHPSVRYEYPINFRSRLSFMLDFVTKKSSGSEAK